MRVVQPTKPVCDFLSIKEVQMFKIKNGLYYILTALVGSTLLTACSLPNRQPDEPEIISLVGSAEAPTLDPNADRDPCLNGYWSMDTADLDLLMASLVPIPNIRVVAGSLNFSFVEGIYDYSGYFTLQMDLDLTKGQYMQTDATIGSGGAYATEIRSDGGGPVLTFLMLDLTVAESNELVWRVYKGGEVQSVPGSGPSFSILPPGNAPYICTDTQLQISTQGAGGPISMFFRR
jgi:hypothetical protein